MISQATTVGTPARGRGLGQRRRADLVVERPVPRKTVSAPTRKSVASSSAAGASASSTRSTLRPSARRSSAKARPSPTGSETVQIARVGGVWTRASRTVAEAECVRTTASLSRSWSWIAIEAAARLGSRESRSPPRRSAVEARRRRDGDSRSQRRGRGPMRPRSPRRRGGSPRARVPRRSGPRAARRTLSNGSSETSSSVSTARLAIQLAP